MKKYFFDTNVLTEINSYSQQTINKIVTALNAIENSSSKIIIPATAYDEFIKFYQKYKIKNKNKNSISFYRKKFNSEKAIMEDRLENLCPNNLSSNVNKNLEIQIDKYITDTKLHFDEIDKQIKILEERSISENISNDCLLDFVEKHKVSPLTLYHKIRMASMAEIRFKENLKPFSNKIKIGKYPFKKYGKVFIWYEILNNTNDNDEIILIENEKRSDWYESKKSKVIASELNKEFSQMYTNSSLEIVPFCDFYTTILKTKQ